MQFKRNEPFRYHFESPLGCTYRLGSTLDRGNVLDISPNGVKIETHSKLYMGGKISISFVINYSELSFLGTLMWEKNFGGKWLYGVQLENDDHQKEMITNEIKDYVRKMKMKHPS